SDATGPQVARGFLEDGEGWSNPSPASSFRWYRFQTVVEIKATHPVRRCRCKACRHLECRSFKNQNDGPLRFGRLFPGWSLSNVAAHHFLDVSSLTPLLAG